MSFTAANRARRSHRQNRRCEIPQKPFPTYPGGKDAGGSAEQIIAALPAHGIYVEPFVGGGAVLRRKTPALSSIAIDDDAEVANRWRRAAWPGLIVIRGDGIRWMETTGRELPADALVYCDPPYPLSTRSKKRLYKNEWTDATHRRFLAAALALPCSVAISTYPNAMYAKALAGWTYHEWPAMTRGGVRTEALYVRAVASGIGRDHRFAGHNFRERERIKRKAGRWVQKFRAMPSAERDAVLAALLQHRQS